MFCKFTPMTRPPRAFIRIPDPDRGPTPTVFCMLQMSREWANLWGRREGRVDRLWADRAVAQVAPSRSRTPLPPVGHTRLPAAPHRIADDLARSADVPGRGEAPIDNVEILGEGGERTGYRRSDRGCGALCANSDEESPEVACPTPEERAYFEEVGQVSQAIGNALQEHADRLGMVVRNESLVFDPNWQADTVEAMVAVRRIIKNFKDNVYAPCIRPGYSRRLHHGGGQARRSNDPGDLGHSRDQRVRDGGIQQAGRGGYSVDRFSHSIRRWPSASDGILAEPSNEPGQDVLMIKACVS